MLLIPCPWCGPRDETEFSYGGEPQNPPSSDHHLLSDDQWADYLFMRNNVRGVHLEQWSHSAGCRRWFYVERNTVTNRISAVFEIGKQIDQRGAK